MSVRLEAAASSDRADHDASAEQRELHARMADRGQSPLLSTGFLPHIRFLLQKVLTANLGSDWRTHFSDFTMIPFAAASIGQVHLATLSPSSPYASLYPPNMRLAVKVQFPGVRDSIASDLNNLKWLLVASSVLPRGLYLENTIKVMRGELDDECDYVREAECGFKMGKLLEGDEEFDTPRVVRELSGSMVLTTEMMEGEPLTKAIGYDKETRDRVSFNSI
jgi:aarF domain-containing kinase